MINDDLEINFAKVLGAVSDPSIQQFCLYIPNKDKKGKKIQSINSWIEEAQMILTLIGGGTTTMPPADGTWLAEDKVNNLSDLKDKEIIREKTTIIYTYIYPDRFEKNLSSLRKVLHRFGRETNQGEVVFEFDGRLYRIISYDE